MMIAGTSQLHRVPLTLFAYSLVSICPLVDSHQIHDPSYGLVGHVVCSFHFHCPSSQLLIDLREGTPSSQHSNHDDNQKHDKEQMNETPDCGNGHHECAQQPKKQQYNDNGFKHVGTQRSE